MEFDWDDANLEHIARHGVEPGEAEEALTDPSATRAGTYRGPSGERRGSIVGKTEDGRVLFVVFTFRRGAVRVVTARNADATEKSRYHRT